MSMDNEKLTHLWALRKVNDSLIDGLELAVFMMDKWDEISMDQRKSMIGKLQELIVMSKKAYGEEPPKH